MSANETLFIFFSKFSRICNQSMSQFQYISPHIQTVLIDIDNPQTRKGIQKLKVVKRVPCALLVNKQFGSADFYEGVDFFNLLNRTIEMIQAKQAKTISQPAETPVASLPVQQVSEPASGAPTKPKKSVTIVEPIEREEESRVDFQPDVASSIMSRAMPSGIKKGEGHENMRSSLSSVSSSPESKFGMGTSIEEDDSEYDDKPKGMTTEEILGSGNGASSARTEKSKSLRTSAEEMMRQRDEMGI